jgi:DHA2 family multidrug resistance protein
MLADIDLQISMGNIVWPQIISGLANGLCFCAVDGYGDRHTNDEQIGNATGIFSLMRNLGGSFGIAGVTTMLARGAQVHQAAMVSHLTPYDPAFQQRFRELASSNGLSMLAMYPRGTSFQEG